MSREAKIAGAKAAVFEAFNSIIRQGYRGIGRPEDVKHLPTPNAALDKLIALASAPPDTQP